MEIETTIDEEWIVVVLRGDASEMDGDAWKRLRDGIPWDRGVHLALDLTDAAGASDRMVETVVGMVADAQGRGGALVVIGMSDDLRARLGSMHVDRYVPEAATLAEARARLDSF